MFLPDANQAMGFVTSQTAHIESEIAEVQYPDIQYPQIIPVDTSADEWATSVQYFSTNKVGAAGWFHHYAKDTHMADVERNKHEVGIEMADIGYRWTLQEIGVAMKTGTPLASERAAAAKRAYEEFLDRIALFGDTSKGYYGISNYPGITSTLVTADGGTGEDETAWALKSDEQVLRDFNNAITGMYVDSLQVELADTVLLPLAVLTMLASRRLGDTNETLMDFLMRKNVYTFQTGRPLLVRSIRGLETAGSGSTGRMIVYRRDPQVLKMHLPMTHRFLPAYQTGPLVFDVVGIFRLAGLEIRRPGAFRYVDGIMDADYE